MTASTKFTGTAVIENLSTGAKVSKTLISLFALCEEDAEWIVEDFEVRKLNAHFRCKELTYNVQIM